MARHLVVQGDGGRAGGSVIPHLLVRAVLGVRLLLPGGAAGETHTQAGAEAVQQDRAAEQQQQQQQAQAGPEKRGRPARAPPVGRVAAQSHSQVGSVRELRAWY